MGHEYSLKSLKVAFVNAKCTGNHKTMTKNNGSSICSFVETNRAGGNDPDV